MDDSVTRYNEKKFGHVITKIKKVHGLLDSVGANIANIRLKVGQHHRSASCPAVDAMSEGDGKAAHTKYNHEDGTPEQVKQSIFNHRLRAGRKRPSASRTKAEHGLIGASGEGKSTTMEIHSERGGSPQMNYRKRDQRRLSEPYACRKRTSPEVNSKLNGRKASMIPRPFTRRETENKTESFRYSGRSRTTITKEDSPNSVAINKITNEKGVKTFQLEEVSSTPTNSPRNIAHSASHANLTSAELRLQSYLRKGTDKSIKGLQSAERQILIARRNNGSSTRTKSNGSSPPSANNLVRHHGPMRRQSHVSRDSEANNFPIKNDHPRESGDDSAIRKPASSSILPEEHIHLMPNCATPGKKLEVIPAVPESNLKEVNSRLENIPHSTESVEKSANELADIRRSTPNSQEPDKKLEQIVSDASDKHEESRQLTIDGTPSLSSLPGDGETHNTTNDSEKYSLPPKTLSLDTMKSQQTEQDYADNSEYEESDKQLIQRIQKDILTSANNNSSAKEQIKLTPSRGRSPHNNVSIPSPETTKSPNTLRSIVRERVMQYSDPSVMDNSLVSTGKVTSSPISNGIRKKVDIYEKLINKRREEMTSPPKISIQVRHIVGKCIKDACEELHTELNLKRHTYESSFEEIDVPRLDLSCLTSDDEASVKPTPQTVIARACFVDTPHDKPTTTTTEVGQENSMTHQRIKSNLKKHLYKIIPDGLSNQFRSNRMIKRIPFRRIFRIGEVLGIWIFQCCSSLCILFVFLYATSTKSGRNDTFQLMEVFLNDVISFERIGQPNSII